jgi:glycine/D-amino acid oxidase-like deaminating enzyme
MGASAAYHLGRRGAKVTVLEADPSYEFASSALSASSIRQQFSSAVCVAMSRYGFEFLRNIGDRLGSDEFRPDVSLVERGYLYLATESQAAGLEAAFAIQKGLGAPVISLDGASLRARFPWLVRDDLAFATFGTAQEGWFDGYSVLQAFRGAARKCGAAFVHAEAVGFEVSGSRITAVKTKSGRLHCDVAVNAAGYRAGKVSEWVGFPAPIAPERRCIFVFDCPDAPRDMPLMIDPSGLYVRPEGGYFLTGGPATPHPGQEPPCFDVDYEQFESAMWPALAHRVPAFERLKLVRGWAGQYEMNTFDHNALIGWTPGCENLAIISGFSGHGMQHAPAAGMAISELILDRGFVTLDLSDLDPRRIVDGKPIRELNII